MMNVLALSLVLSTLATAGVLSPPRPPEKQEDVMIVKEGHRVVVVEYEKGHGGNTKVSISPHESSGHDENMIIPENLAEEKGEKTDGSYKRWAAPKELVCDAFGKCKHRIASAFERTRDTAAETAHEAVEKVRRVDEGARDTVGKVRDAVVDKGHQASEAAGKVRDTVVGTGNKAAEKAVEVEEGARDAVGEQLGKVRGKVADIRHGATEKAEAAKEMARDAASRAKDMTKSTSQSVEASYKTAKETVGEVKDSWKEKVVRSAHRAFGMANLFGVGIAYGTCVWVTFVSSYVLARALPRQQFAIVQSRIYPVYFKAMAYSIGTALLGHLLSHNSKTGHKFMGFNLLFSLLMVLVNLLYLEPRASKVMFERMKMEKEEGKGSDPTAGEFNISTVAEKKQKERAPEGTNAAKLEMIRLSRLLKKLNSYSSFLNVVTLMSLTLYIANVSQRHQTAPC